jgi:hypothetical protein
MRDQTLVSIAILIDMVLKENSRQINKWDIQDHDAFTWLGFVIEEIGETSKAISELYFRDGSKEEVVKEAIQAATLLLKIAEMFNSTEGEGK